MNTQCVYEGCEADIKKGNTLYRVSPKGKGMAFEGMCLVHMRASQTYVDPVVRKVVEALEAVDEA